MAGHSDGEAAPNRQTIADDTPRTESRWFLRDEEPSLPLMVMDGVVESRNTVVVRSPTPSMPGCPAPGRAIASRAKRGVAWKPPIPDGHKAAPAAIP
jgi:hypothetical protein